VAEEEVLGQIIEEVLVASLGGENGQ